MSAPLPPLVGTTQDAASTDGWSAWRGPAAAAPEPRLRLLYHCDPSRIGSVSSPHTFSDGGDWLLVGRNEPAFAAMVPRSAAEPIGDPQVSRQQLRIRWLEGEQRFEVEPIAEARRPIFHVRLGATSVEEPVVAPLTGAVRLEPGSCIAIGDRVLLGLELARTRGPDEHRLGLVGESDVLWAVRDEVLSTVAFGRPVLVTGPTGAGKELVARALHEQGPRASGPFVAVNCATLPDKLVESTLFGHKRGAFTGADANEPGLFRAAHGGTLFLDELAELPMAAQAKLLRVIQEGVVVPVGATEGRRVDVRLVTATHRDLAAEVAAGTVREDLYHRVAAHVIRVPSLDARRFDVPELFMHALSRLRAEHAELEWLWSSGATWRPALPIGFFADLLRRDFPGNVRELLNLVERTARLNLQPGLFRAPDSSDAPAARFAPAHSATPTGAPATSIVDETPPIARRAATPDSDDTSVPEALVRAASEALGLAHKTVLKLLPAPALEDLFAEAERDSLSDEARTARLRSRCADAVLALLETEDFNQSSVAATLGTSRTTLIKLMEDLGLPRATDLDAEAIRRARDEAGGDLDAAARLLRVSPSALKKRLTLLNLKTRV